MVVTHKGCGLPYQLHCCTQDCKLDELEELKTGADDDDLEGADDEVDGADEVGVPLHTAPLIVGISAAAPFLFNWKPKVAVPPGCKLPFQLRLVAV